MPQLRKRDWTFKEGIYGTAVELKVPYSRVYNLLPKLGLKEVEREEDLQRLALSLLNEGGISVEGLAKVFGPSATISTLFSIAQKLGVEFPVAVERKASV